MSIRLGIIGAGQLGLYLCDAAQRLGVHTAVLSEGRHDPANQRAGHVVTGSLQDPDTIERFIQQCDLVTFEKEDIPNTALSALWKAEQAGRIHVRPGAQAMFVLKDKGLQKAWLQDNGFPRLPHRLIDERTEEPVNVVLDMGLPVVQKSRCGGYDGRGVQVLEQVGDLHRLWDTPSLLEPYLSERREIAVLCARNPANEIVTYPPVELQFDPERNVLRRVTTMEGGSDLETRARDLSERLVEELDGVGLFAIELFVTRHGELLVNEISPRVHNSGHLTMEACSVSQFEQHIRAVVGMPLVAVAALRPSAMVNILADESVAACCPTRPVSYLREDQPVSVHWYGKAPDRPGRKIGHITALADREEGPGAAAERADHALRSLYRAAGPRAA